MKNNGNFYLTIGVIVIIGLLITAIVMGSKQQNAAVSTVSSAMPSNYKLVQAKNQSDAIMKYADMIKKEYTTPSSATKSPYTNILSALPVGDMSSSSVEGDQPIIYDRAIYSNQKSRLRGGADWIRGDLAIVPNKTGWFRPSVKPDRDLNAGAIFAISGSDNSNTKELAKLMNYSSGGKMTTFAGVNYASTLSGAGDVEIVDCPQQNLAGTASDCAC